MRKLLLSFILTGLGASAIAQCTPNPMYADSTFGVWPDTTTNFVIGYNGVAYFQQLDLKIPASASDLGPDYPPLQLDSVVFLSITGLPPGLSYSCNSQTPAPCTYLPLQLGCGVIIGTPTQTGTFELALNVRGYSTVFGSVVDADHTFTGYRITVMEASGILEAPAIGLAGVRNVPNPFATRTAFEFQLGAPTEVDLRVFNLLGEELWTLRVNGKPGVNKIPFESGNLPEGVYLFKIESGKETFTGRMVIHR